MEWGAGLPACKTAHNRMDWGEGGRACSIKEQHEHVSTHSKMGRHEDGLPQHKVSKPQGKGRQQREVLVVGNYCHDVIQLPRGVEAEVLGGSVSYIGNVLDAVGVDALVVAKVGPDFAYSESSAPKAHPPRVVPGLRTTQFFADLSKKGEERVLRAGNLCEPIFPWDIPGDCQFRTGLAVGVAGEIRADTLERMAAASDCLVVDVQALIRTIEPGSGVVGLCPLRDTPFYPLLHKVAYLKASSSEAAFIDLEEVRQRTCVIVTQGRDGSRVYGDGFEFLVPPFAAEEVDPTGAGDSFLAGFCTGLHHGLEVGKAVLMGNYFGALAVGQVGVPTFSALQLQMQLQGWGCNGLRQGMCMILESNPLLGINDGCTRGLGAGSVCSP